MREVLPPTEFDRIFRERLARCRIESDLTQAEIAAALGVQLDTYKKYENRPKSEMPLYLIPRFAKAVGRSIDYLFTGQETAEEPRARRRGPRLVGLAGTR